MVSARRSWAPFPARTTLNCPSVWVWMWLCMVMFITMANILWLKNTQHLLMTGHQIPSSASQASRHLIQITFKVIRYKFKSTLKSMKPNIYKWSSSYVRPRQVLTVRPSKYLCLSVKASPKSTPLFQISKCATKVPSHHSQVSSHSIQVHSHILSL